MVGNLNSLLFYCTHLFQTWPRADRALRLRETCAVIAWARAGAFLLGMFTASVGFGADALVSYRAWEFSDLDVPYGRASMESARDYGINTVVFPIPYVSQLFAQSELGTRLRELANEAHAKNLRVGIWVRELEGVPAQFLDGKVVDLDRPGFWEWLTGRYEELFRKFPECDGLVLTFHESPAKIFDPKEVKSKLSMPERFAAMINTIERVCARHSKDFIVRSFLYEPQEIAWFKEGFEKTDPRVTIQTKCEPHDWHPFYPHDPLIGAFPGRKQIVEFDGSSEYTGRNRVPYTQPEYFERRWRYDLSKGAVGYSIRINWGGFDALHTPNAINLYAMYRMSQSAAVSADQIWKDWTRSFYGESAAPFVERALRPTFDVVNKSFFTLEFWITNHSVLPNFAYADGHITERTLAKWYPGESHYKELEERLHSPDPLLLEQILAEKDEAVALADRALQALFQGKKAMQPAQFDDLCWRLNLLRRTAVVWKLHAEAFFGLKVLLAGHKVPGLQKRVQRALDALELQASVSAADASIGDQPPASAKEIRSVISDLRARLAKLSAN